LKLDARTLDRFLQNPGATRAVLLHGEDAGLIRTRAAALVRVVIGPQDDPFRLADLDRETHARLTAEMTAGSLTGGRRVVRVRDAADALTAAVQTALSGPGDALLILEAGALTTKSKLRSFCEPHPDVATIACYREEARSLEQTIRTTLAARQVAVDPQALGWLVTQLGADHGITRQELEKLALYVGPGGTVDLAAAMTCVGDNAGLQLDDALFAAISGDVPGADRALETALAEGATPVGVLRAALLHLQRLQRARAAMDEGAPASDAVRTLRPPLFGRRASTFTAALPKWSTPTLAGATAFIASAERDCKRSGAPAEVLCRQAVLSIARRARA
jgi:DNA polymerase-3 subunit delta